MEEVPLAGLKRLETSTKYYTDALKKKQLGLLGGSVKDGETGDTSLGANRLGEIWWRDCEMDNWR